MSEPRRPWHVPRRWDPHADIVPVTQPADQAAEAQETAVEQEPNPGTPEDC